MRENIPIIGFHANDFPPTGPSQRFPAAGIVTRIGSKKNFQDKMTKYHIPGVKDFIRRALKFNVP
ncbi:TPA: hypothetical protein HA338_11020 [Methanosarcina acetivorans]|uniref:Uncharacterized protein n=1 Tax=Methanosarcina acetivorans TaxID=2214 RepID=A0A832S8U2_9EURY|nr:hypothetical protein [Methanosarcina acetivorans]HIH94526.1 hypothetical protein [Methanosarcina acetivorans]